MATIYILMVLISGNQDTVAFQEFSSLESCSKAKSKLVNSPHWSVYSAAYCTPR